MTDQFGSPSLPRRFWEKVAMSDTGCWLWMAAKDMHGYGTISSAGRDMGAHRFSYIALVGPIAPGLHLDHLCRVRHCVNPEHLEAVTPAVNIRRGVGVAAQNARKTHCPQGHEYTPENTFSPPSRAGKRRCRTCHNASGRKRRSREIREETP